jgi:hypothetical protein
MVNDHVQVYGHVMTEQKIWKIRAVFVSNNVVNRLLSVFLRFDYWNQQTDLHETCDCCNVLAVTVAIEVGFYQHIKVAVFISQHPVLRVRYTDMELGNSNKQLVTYSCTVCNTVTQTLTVLK